MNTMKHLLLLSILAVLPSSGFASPDWAYLPKSTEIVASLDAVKGRQLSAYKRLHKSWDKCGQKFGAKAKRITIGMRKSGRKAVMIASGISLSDLKACESVRPTEVSGVFAGKDALVTSLPGGRMLVADPKGFSAKAIKKLSQRKGTLSLSGQQKKIVAKAKGAKGLGWVVFIGRHPKAKAAWATFKVTGKNLEATGEVIPNAPHSPASLRKAIESKIGMVSILGGTSTVTESKTAVVLTGSVPLATLENLAKM